MAPYSVLSLRLLAGRGFPPEIGLRASTRNGGQSAGHRGRGHRAVAFLRSGARQNGLIVAVSRIGLGTRMGREGSSDVHRNLRSVAVRRGVTVAPTRPGEPIGRFTQRR